MDNNNERRWNTNSTIKITIDGIITITMELDNIQVNGTDAIGVVQLTHGVWIQ